MKTLSNPDSEYLYGLVSFSRFSPHSGQSIVICISLFGLNCYAEQLIIIEDRGDYNSGITLYGPSLNLACPIAILLFVYRGLYYVTICKNRFDVLNIISPLFHSLTKMVRGGEIPIFNNLSYLSLGLTSGKSFHIIWHGIQKSSMKVGLKPTNSRYNRKLCLRN